MTEKILRFRWLIIAVMVLAFAQKTVQAQPTVALEQPDLVDGYYQIENEKHLYWFAALVNGKLEDGTPQNTAACAKLIKNITVNSNVLDAKGNLNNENTGFYEWTPIGSSYNYTGTFDGQGHTVSGLYVNKITESSDPVGLFGNIGKFDNGGTVQNVGVEDSYFNVTITGYDGLRLDIGGVCGNNNNGTITNCYNTGTISGTVDNANVGGVCGSNFEGTITNCYNTGTISGTGGNASVGGVCGFNRKNITNCYNTETISGTGNNAQVGGVCGYNEETITNCYNTGTTISETGNYAMVGGVCGATNDEAEISNCYYLNNCASGGSVLSTEGNGMDIDDFNSGKVTWLLNGKKKGTTWLQNLSKNGGGDQYPMLKANTANGVCPIVEEISNDNYNNVSHSYENKTIATTSDEGYDNLYSYICDNCKSASTDKKMIKKLNGEADIYSITVNWIDSEWKTKEDGTEGNTVILNDDPSKNGYNAPVVFTVTRAIHTHKIATEWSTLCLPYQITINNYTDKCKFYDLSSVGTDNITLTELNGTCTDIEAGKPVFIKRKDNTVTEIRFDEKNVKMIQIPTEQNVNGDNFVGTFNTVELTKEANQDHLFIKNDNMWSVKQTGKDKMIVRPFRAYIIPATSNGDSKRSIVIDGEATAISDALDTLNDANAEYYDMSGRRINSLQKGVNIIRSGNKTRKVIIK